MRRHAGTAATLAMIPLLLILVIAFARMQFPKMGGCEGGVKVGTRA